MNINAKNYTDDYGSITSDHRLKTTEATHLFNGSFIYDTSDLLWETYQSVGGTLTHLADSCGIRMAIGAATGNTLIRQTKKYFRYTPNKTQKLVVSIIFGTTKTGVLKRIGLFDSANGFFWEHRENGMYIVRRSSVTGSMVDTSVHSSSWNIDKLDGKGPSQIVVDWTKIQLLYIEYMWQGSGCIVFSIQHGKKIHPVHVIQAGNELSEPHMGRPDLPIRYTIAAIPTETPAGADSFDAFSGSVITEGTGEEATSLTFGADSGTTAKVTGQRVPILTIRPKLTYNAITNRGFIEPIKAEVISSGAAVVAEIVINGVIGSGVFNSVHSNSLTEYDNSGVFITGGISLGKFYVPSGQKECFDRYEFKKNSIPITIDSSGNLATNLSIVVSPLAGGSASVHGLINWKELQ